MVAPVDYINFRYSNALDREIMLILNNLKDRLSSSEIMGFCSLTHHGGKRYGIRAIESRLKILAEKGSLNIEKKPTGGVGAPTKIYCIGKKFKKEYEDYKIPEQSRHVQIVSYVASRKE